MKPIHLFHLLSISLLCCSCGGNSPGSTTKQKPKPNFIIILADDLGYGDLGCYGHQFIQTPHLDQLAADGLLFTDCYASAPMCSPSRAGLLTGRVPYRTGIYDWIAPDSSMHLPPEELSIAKLLKQNNYETSIIGKWHLNGKFNSREQTQPVDHGFDYSFATQYSIKHKDPKGFYRNGIELDTLKGYSCQIVASEALEWLLKTRDKAKPFFQFITFHEPHEPIMSPPNYVEKYSSHGIKADYYANVQNMDYAVGRIMAGLMKEGLEENTLVIFTSDNGPAEYTPNGYFNKSHGSAGPLRGYKRHQYEGGIRVPGIMRWPGKIKSGSRATEPVSNIDFFPTLCNLAGIQVPKEREIDGTDVSPLFSNQKIFRKTLLHWHFYDPWGGPQSLIRDGKWMLGAYWDVGDFHKSGRFDPIIEIPIIRESKLDSFELFNLSVDYHQDNNMAIQYPQITDSLSRQLTQLHKEIITHAPFPKKLD